MGYEAESRELYERYKASARLDEVVQTTSKLCRSLLNNLEVVNFSKAVGDGVES